MPEKRKNRNVTNRNLKRRRVIEGLRKMVVKMEILRQQYKGYKARLNSMMGKYTHENTSNYTKRTEYNAYLLKFARQTYGKPLLREKRSRSLGYGGYNANNNNN